MPINIDKLRRSAEADVSAALAGYLSEQYDGLLEELDPEKPFQPDTNWWDNWQAELMVILGVALLKLSNDSSEFTMEEYGIGVDWSAVLSSSQRWATSYSFDLVRGITGTTQAALQDLLSQYYAGTINYTTLESMIAQQFGPMRALSIARTETTRAIEQGIDVYQDQLEALGIGTDRVWHTEPGACPICEPYDGVLESEGWDDGEPPLHPNCACDTEIIILPGEKNFTRTRYELVHP
jgi:hypothetical protein